MTEQPVGRYRAVVLDFDGTIADTFPAISTSVDIALTRYGMPPADRSLLRVAVGLNLPGLFGVVTGGLLPRAQIDRLVAVYAAVFPGVANCAGAVTMFDGIAAQIDRLRRSGIAVAIATSRPSWSARDLLCGLGVGNLCDVVVGDDMVTVGKPNPEMLHKVVETLGVPAGQSVMVGDAEYDLLMGRAAGMATCAVTWGNQPRERLAAQRPDHICDSPGELAAVLGCVAQDDTAARQLPNWRVGPPHADEGRAHPVPGVR